MTLTERLDTVTKQLQKIAQQNQEAIDFAARTKQQYEYYQAQRELLQELVKEEQPTPGEGATLPEESLPPFVAHGDLPETA